MVPCLGNGTVHSGMGLPTSVNWSKAIPPIDTPTGQLHVSDLSWRLSSQVTIGCIKVTKLSTTNTIIEVAQIITFAEL